MNRCEKCLHRGQETMSDVGSCNCCDNGEFFSPMPGYLKFAENEPFILEPEDWTASEWGTLCKLCGLTADRTERIVMHINEIECFIDEIKTQECVTSTDEKNNSALTVKQKLIIEELNHPIYTLDYIEEWYNRKDDVTANAVAALIEMGVSGFMDAVRAVEQLSAKKLNGGTDNEHKRRT